MRRILLGFAILLAPCALTSCLHSDKSNWKKEALARCNAETDPMSKQTCFDEIAAVQHERDKVP